MSLKRKKKNKIEDEKFCVFSKFIILLWRKTSHYCLTLNFNILTRAVINYDTLFFLSYFEESVGRQQQNTMGQYIE